MSLKDEAQLAKYMLLGYEFGPIPAYGTKMSIESLIKICSGHSWLSGHGFYSFGGMITTQPVTGKMINDGLVNNDFTEVIWFVDK